MISLGTIGAAREMLARITTKAIEQRMDKVSINDEKVAGILAETKDLVEEINALDKEPTAS